MNVYQAVFHATLFDLKVTSAQFIKKFDRDTFDKYILPYLDIDHPGIIFAAVTAPHKFWFIDRLAENAARAKKQGYEQPPEFIALEMPDNVVTIPCPRCNVTMEERFSCEAKSFGFKRVCLMCYTILSQERTDEQVAKMKSTSNLATQ